MTYKKHFVRYCFSLILQRIRWWFPGFSMSEKSLIIPGMPCLWPPWLTVVSGGIFLVTLFIIKKLL